MSAPTLNGARLPDERALHRGSVESERALLGAMMLARDAAGHVPGEIRELLAPGEGQTGAGEHHFTVPSHRRIYRLLLAQMDAGDPLDPLALLAVMDEETLRVTGGYPYLSDCAEQCTNVLSGPQYARNVANASALRQAAEIGVEAARQAGTAALDDTEQVVEELRRRVGALTLPGIRSNMVAWETIGADALDEMQELEKLAQDETLAEGIFSTGWPDLDRLLGNVKPGSLLIVAGRPSQGKSIVGRGIAQHLAMRKNLPALLFSLEMSRSEIGLAMMCAGARIHTQAVKHGTMSEEDWLQAGRYYGATAGAPLEVDDTPAINQSYIDRALTSSTRKYGRPPAAYVLDYLGLQTPEGRGGNRQEEVATMIRQHKLNAKKHQTVAVVLAQINRGPESRTDKRPQLSDLRESGSIEQDADVAILVYRDDYYDKESPRAGEADLIVAKNRSGPTDTITVAAQLHLSRFVSMAI